MKNTKDLLYLDNIIILFILFYLSFRIIIDFVYIDEKPMIAKVGFTLLSLSLIVYNGAKLVNKTDIVLFFFASLMLVYPLAFSQEVIGKQLAYNLKVLLIPLVILACSHLDIPFEKLRNKARIVIPITITIALIYFFSRFTLNIPELYVIFNNNPFHPISQTVAKLSFLFLYAKSYFLFFFLGVLILLNIRSNLFPILVIVLFQNLNKYFKYVLFGGLLLIAVLLIISSINPDLVSFDSILERFITKNRSQDHAGEGLDNLSSGRTEIWGFYFNYIAEKFTLINYLFGTGSLEMQGKYRINAHNDFINIIVNFGIFGFITLGYIYYEIYKRLDSRYRNYIAFYFVFVFLANGIMFHQSNIFFLLYLRDNNNFGNGYYDDELESNNHNHIMRAE